MEKELYIDVYFFLRLFVLTMSLVDNVASNRTEIQCIPRMNEAVEVAVVK